MYIVNFITCEGESFNGQNMSVAEIAAIFTGMLSHSLEWNSAVVLLEDRKTYLASAFTDGGRSVNIFAVLGNKSRPVAFSIGECVSVSATEFKYAMNESDTRRSEFYYDLLNHMLSCIAERVAEGKIKSALVV